MLKLITFLLGILPLLATLTSGYILDNYYSDNTGPFRYWGYPRDTFGPENSVESNNNYPNDIEDAYPYLKPMDSYSKRARSQILPAQSNSRHQPNQPHIQYSEKTVVENPYPKRGPTIRLIKRANSQQLTNRLANQNAYPHY